MTGQSCIRNNSQPDEWAAAVQKKHLPVILSPTEQKATSSGFISPQLYCSPTAGSLAVWRPSKRRRALDRFSVRLADSDLVGADRAIEYLQDKYSKNQAVDTITQAGGVILFFLTFLNEIGTNIFKISRKDITSFVQNEQDRGLKISSVKGYLRTVYAFISFLVEQEILPDTILHKKILIKLPELLPRAIPSEDIETLLAAINKVRDRALILLLLRTGMRIGELLNVKVADIILPERKILLYLGKKNYQGRVVYFGEDAEVALHEWLRIRKQKKYLFYSPTRENLSYVAAWMMMKKILERAGLFGKEYSLHSLRHTFATDMLNAGLRVEVLQRLLGHQSLDITMRYARMSNTTRESEYFKAMTVIEQGEHHESYQVNSQLQAVFEEKKLLISHS